MPWFLWLAENLPQRPWHRRNLRLLSAAPDHDQRRGSRSDGQLDLLWHQFQMHPTGTRWPKGSHQKVGLTLGERSDPALPSL